RRQVLLRGGDDDDGGDGLAQEARHARQQPLAAEGQPRLGSTHPPALAAAQHHAADLHAIPFPDTAPRASAWVSCLRFAGPAKRKQETPPVHGFSLISLRSLSSGKASRASASSGPTSGPKAP